MNRKKKINDLYKGVFKNDRRGCLVDLKPLENKQEPSHPPQVPADNIHPNANRNNLNPHAKHNPIHPPKQLNISLKVAKNLGFGSFFKNLREEIVDVFLERGELISFEGMFNQKDMSDLFNFKESAQKTAQGNMRTSFTNNFSNNNANLLNDLNQSTNSTEKEVILYEDEENTIYKRKKLKSKLSVRNEQRRAKDTRFFPVNNNKSLNDNQVNNSFAFQPYQYNPAQIGNASKFSPMNDNQEMSQGMFTPEKSGRPLGNNFTKNSVRFLNKISNCRNRNCNYVSIPNLNYH